VIAIVEAGPLTTVQDLGRFGQLRYGIPPAGPLDHPAFVLANRLVGNPDGAAALECTLAGPRFEARGSGAIAVTGADVPVSVNGVAAPTWTTVALNAGDVVKVGMARSGVRAYIAFAGGIDVPLVLGSRATYVRGRLGGLEGRALKKGDALGLLPSRRVATPRRVRASAIPVATPDTELRVVLGPQDDRFTADGIATFLGSAYEMQPQSDRMGARLRGPVIEHRAGHDIISDGIALGSVQVTGDGMPIVLLVDRQSTGGYTKVATVCSFDVARLAQAKPGHRVHFRAVTVHDAHRLLRERQGALDDVLEEI
jgi:antagonist of KipI